jgi:predicted nucleic acid-binding protein
MSVVLAPDFVLAVLDRDAAGHADASAWVRGAEEDLVTTPLALALVDERARERGGEEAAAAVREDFARGAYAVRWWADALDETLAVARKRRLDLVHASLVALAGRLRTDRVASFEATFRDLRTPAGKPFVMLPAEA